MTRSRSGAATCPHATHTFEPRRTTTFNTKTALGMAPKTARKASNPLNPRPKTLSRLAPSPTRSASAGGGGGAARRDATTRPVPSGGGGRQTPRGRCGRPWPPRPPKPRTARILGYFPPATPRKASGCPVSWLAAATIPNDTRGAATPNVKHPAVAAGCRFVFAARSHRLVRHTYRPRLSHA